MAVRLILPSVFGDGTHARGELHFHAVNVWEIPSSSGLKVWRFIAADRAATGADEPMIVVGFETGGATIVA